LLGFPISRPLAACCVCLEPRPLPSTGITRLQRYCEPLNPIRCGRLSVSRPSSARRLRSEDARPLALNDDELAALMDCARPLHPRDRAEFLREAAAELSKFEVIGVGVIHRVCSRLQRAHLNPPRYLNGVSKYGH